MVYNKFSDYLKNKYGEKVYKLPIKLDGTCPNRDGNISFGGCAFCGEEGGSFENLDSRISVRDQVETNKAYISSRYKAGKFISYFQNFTNTYLNLDLFKDSIIQAIDKDIVAIYISTRPDCVRDDQLDFLRTISHKYNIDIIFELGLQTVNYKILKDLNRGHSLAEYIDSVLRIHKYGFEVCTHIIIGLPGEDEDDIIEASKIISSLKTSQVKIHALYILENTVYGDKFKAGQIEPISLEEYINRTILFLRYLSPSIVVQRLIGRSDENASLFSNWGYSWWKIRDQIEDIMEKNKFKQGDLFNYLHTISKDDY